MSSVVSIKIQGRVYTLRSQESEDQIQKVVDLVEKKLAETAADRSVDTVDLMILTLLNLAGEYLQLGEQQRLDLQETQERLESLEERIQAVIGR